MDPELATLISTGATTIVGLLATDGWERVKERTGRLWQRVHPERAEVVEAELVETRTEVLTAREALDKETEQALVTEWHGRLRRLLAADLDVADELRRMVLEFRESAPSETTRAEVGDVDMRARASGHGRVYQAGRDQHITER